MSEPPADGVAAREATIAIAQQLTAVVAGWFPWAPADEVEPHLVWSAGFLARCRALLAGMAAVLDSGNDECLGALYRPLLETYLHGVYVCLGGTPALEAVHADALLRRYQLDALLGQTKSSQVPDEARELKIDRLVKEVSRLLRRVSPQDGRWARRAYRYHYRPTSYHDVHGGIGAASRYVSDPGTGPVVAAVREGSEGVFLLEMAMSLVLSLSVAWGSRTDMDLRPVVVIEREWRQATQH